MALRLAGWQDLSNVKRMCHTTACEACVALRRAARSSFSEAQCLENVAAVIAGAVDHIPRKWANVQVNGFPAGVRARLRKR